MADLRARIENWYTEHSHEIIRCPYQPGNLLISRYACWKRRARANKENLTDLMAGDISTYIFKKGLALCKDCRMNAHRASARRPVAAASYSGAFA